MSTDLSITLAVVAVLAFPLVVLLFWQPSAAKAPAATAPIDRPRPLDRAYFRPGVITLTPRAAEMYGAFAQADPAVRYLRIAIEGGVDGAFSHALRLETVSRVGAGVSDDLWCESNGVTILVDKVSVLFVEGTTIDYQSSEGREGFKFDNPNVEKRV